MTQSRFFQLSLVLPVLLWGLALLFFAFVTKQSYSFIMNNVVDGLRVFLPYAVFSGAVWKLAEDRPYRVLLLMAFVVPIVWGFFFTLCCIPHYYYKERTLDIKVLAMMGFWATVVAYLAETIPYLILIIFKNNFRTASAPQPDCVPLDQMPAAQKN